MLALLSDERGTVTAEFAVVLPAVLVMLGLAIGGVFLASHRIVLVALAGEVARLEARGDLGQAQQRLAGAGSSIAVERERTEDLHCVVLRSQPAEGLLGAVRLEARACAAASGDAEGGAT